MIACDRPAAQCSAHVAPIEILANNIWLKEKFFLLESTTSNTVSVDENASLQSSTSSILQTDVYRESGGKKRRKSSSDQSDMKVAKF